MDCISFSYHRRRHRNLCKHSENGAFFSWLLYGYFSICFLYQAKLGFRPKDAIQGIFDNEFKNISISVIFLLAYAFFLELLGFLISTPVAIFLLTRFILKEKGWKINFLFPVCMTGTIYVIFIILLNSNLPKGTLF